MGILEAPQPGSDAWWRDTKQKINDLQRELDQLRAAVGKYGAVFNENGITIRDGGNLTIEDDGNFVIGEDAALRILGDEPGTSVGYFGNLWREGEYVGRGLFINTGDGRRIATITENRIDGDGYFEFRDGEGNVLLGNDRAAGFGLSHPKMQYPVMENPTNAGAPGASLGWPSTESATYVRFGETGELPITHPFMNIRVEGGNGQPTDVMVQYRVWAFGHVIVESDPISASRFSEWSWTWDVTNEPGRFGTTSAHMYFDMRKVSGTGPAYARVRPIIGRGSL